MLTPIEIHNKEFPTKFKGYDPEEVNDYLDEVIRTVEQLIRENKDLEKRVKFNEEKVLPFTNVIFKDKIQELVEKEIISQQSRVMYVNDGSTDDTWNLIEEYSNSEFVVGISQSRNRGHQSSVLAGIFEAKKYADVVITEIGGTTGDIESLPFLEAIRQIRSDLGRDNVCFIHCTLLPYIKAAGEMKTKPTQQSVKELRGLGIQPDIIVVRNELALNDELRAKISLFCDIPKQNVIESRDVSNLYQLPVNLKAQKIDDIVLNHFGLTAPEADMTEWLSLVDRVDNLKEDVRIALVGKYVELHDAYISVVESLKHAGYKHNAKVKIDWIQSEDITEENVHEYLKDADGILVPGGFGDRGVEGKITTIKYARENKVPFFGICLGMQLAAVEFARNVCGLTGAHSSELDPNTPYPIINLLADQENVVEMGGTLRLGSCPCTLTEGSVAHREYGEINITERHRHRYEFNNFYRDRLSQKGMVLSGVSPDGKLVEIVEIPEHPWFVAGQFHPEFKSRPEKAHPLFAGFIKASLENNR